MPYRNALRDNWRRFNDANDAEMRMYAQERAMSQPQGRYAATEAEALSMDDIGYDAQGNLVILGQQQPGYNADNRMQMPQIPQQMLQNQEEQGMNNIELRRRRMAEQLQGTGY
jgi:hypothetical protein